MSDFKYPTKEQYKELDELMTYILDEMWGTDDKQLIREGIIAYANKWHETQANGADTRESNCNIPLVSNNEVAVCDYCKGTGKAMNVKRDLPCQICNGTGKAN